MGIGLIMPDLINEVERGTIILVMTQIFWAFTTETGPDFPGAAFGPSAFLMVACMVVFLARPRHVTA